MNFAYCKSIWWSQNLHFFHFYTSHTFLNFSLNLTSKCLFWSFFYSSLVVEHICSIFKAVNARLTRYFSFLVSISRFQLRNWRSETQKTKDAKCRLEDLKCSLEKGWSSKKKQMFSLVFWDFDDLWMFVPLNTWQTANRKSKSCSFKYLHTITLLEIKKTH
jgi:hypothetical protein